MNTHKDKPLDVQNRLNVRDAFDKMLNTHLVATSDASNFTSDERLAAAHDLPKTVAEVLAVLQALVISDPALFDAQVVRETVRTHPTFLQRLFSPDRFNVTCWIWMALGAFVCWGLR